ncbi:helix-turn-helix domain-containing protein [Streptomyces mirabilis]|uniref:helix-turn-helix domain-containing protein n=1 Tax=Streptomyces mirabilis TaxID=68239 RepID=UPI0036CC3CA4
MASLPAHSSLMVCRRVQGAAPRPAPARCVSAVRFRVGLVPSVEWQELLGHRFSLADRASSPDSGLSHRSPCCCRALRAAQRSISNAECDYAQLFMVSVGWHRSSRCVPAPESSPDPRLLSLGMQIRRLREDRGYSLEELAERSGLSFRGLIYIEHGRRNPGVLTILDIAKGLEVPPGDILNPVVEEGAAQKPAAQ